MRRARLELANLSGCDFTDAALNEANLQLMRDVGLGGVMVPPPAPWVPPLIDRYYDPLWARCAELAMPVHVHSGWGGYIDPRMTRTAIGDDFASMNWSARAIGAVENSWMGRRALWMLILGGLLSVVFGLIVAGLLIAEPRGVIALWDKVKSYFQAWPYRYV